jgi:MFS family permease
MIRSRGHENKASESPALFHEEPLAEKEQNVPVKTEQDPRSLEGALPDQTPPTTAEYPTGIRFVLIISSLAAALMLGSLDLNIVSTAVPRITDAFHTVSDVGWYASALRLSACAMQFLFGKSYRLFCTKHVFLVANGLSLLGSLLSGAAVDSSMLIVGRAVAGVGFAGLLSGCYAELVYIVPLRRRPIWISVLGALESVAIVGAPLLGGVVTQYLSWRWCFWISLPVGAVTLVFMVFALPKDEMHGDVAGLTLKQKLVQLDIPSNVLLLLSLTSLFLALSWGDTRYPWSDGRVIGPLVTSVVLALLFAANQIRLGDAAVLPPRIFRQRSVAAGFLFVSCTNSVINVSEYYLPTYFQAVLGVSPATSGYFLAPIIVGGAVGALLGGFGTSHTGYYGPFVLLAAVLMPIATGLISTFGIAAHTGRILGYIALAGIANGIGFTGPYTAVQTVMAEDDVPSAMSVLLFSQSFGPAVSLAVAQLLFTNNLVRHLQGLIPSTGVGAIQDQGLMQLVADAQAGPRRTAVLMGILESLRAVWYLVVGLACLTFVGCVLIEWRSIKSKASRREMPQAETKA